MTTLDASETAAAAARRAAITHLDTALAQLVAEPDGRDKAVHTARKSVKKARAMLRLIRSGLDEGVYARDNAALRDASRRLAPVRDAWVNVETLDTLTAHYADALSPGVYDGLREALAARHAEVSAAVLDDPAVLQAVATALRDVRDRVETWAGDADDEVVEAGLRRTYGQGRNRFAAAVDTPTPERLHDWRKRVKDLGYQVGFLTPVWSPVAGAVASECAVTWGRLGDDHDLAVLRDVADELSDRFSTPADLALLDDLIDRRREELSAGAIALGRRLYAEKPKRFARRVGAYLRAWRRDVATTTP